MVRTCLARVGLGAAKQAVLAASGGDFGDAMTAFGRLETTVLGAPERTPGGAVSVHAEVPSEHQRGRRGMQSSCRFSRSQRHLAHHFRLSIGFSIDATILAFGATIWAETATLWRQRGVCRHNSWSFSGVRRPYRHFHCRCTWSGWTQPGAREAVISPRTVCRRDAADDGQLQHRLSRRVQRQSGFEGPERWRFVAPTAVSGARQSAGTRGAPVQRQVQQRLAERVSVCGAVSSPGVQHDARNSDSHRAGADALNGGDGRTGATGSTSRLAQSGTQ